MYNESSYKSDSQNIYQSLKARSQIIEKYLGEGMSDSALFGRMLVDAPEKDRNRIEKEILSSFRLLPSYSKFSKQIKDWSDSASDELSA